MKKPHILLHAWLAFVITGTFFALTVPLGEGFDEPWHLAYLQHVAQVRAAPLGHSSYISGEVESFLTRHPVSWGLHKNFPALQSYEEYWKQNPTGQDSVLKNSSFSGRYVEARTDMSFQYERHQPPLYYVIAAPVFLAASRAFSFMDTFMVMRLFSVLLASLIVPGTFFLANLVLEDKSAVASVLGLVVTFSGLYPGVVRVSNDALTAALTCWSLYFLVLFIERRRNVHLYFLSALLVAGLWTKAFFIPILIGILIVLMSYGRSFRAAGIVLATSIAGWGWYAYNMTQTGSVTGLPETLVADTTVESSIRVLWELDWTNLLNVLTFSHVWIGNGSLLNVRSWMYQVIFWFFLLGVAGFLRRPRGSARIAVPLGIPYAVFLGGLVYYATQVFQHTGATVAQGWYLTSFIPAEAILFVAGIRTWFRRRWQWAAATLQLFCLMLLVYGAVFVAIPYYAGITAHSESGHLTTYHAEFSDLQLVPSRVLRFHPWIPDFVPWFLLAVVVCLGFSSIIRTARPAHSSPRSDLLISRNSG